MQSWSATASSGPAHPGPCRTTWVPSTCWGQCCRPRGSSPTPPVPRCAKCSPSTAFTLWPRATATSSKPCVQESEADATRPFRLTVHSLLALVMVVDKVLHITEWLLSLHQVQTCTGVGIQIFCCVTSCVCVTNTCPIRHCHMHMPWPSLIRWPV